MSPSLSRPFQITDWTAIIETNFMSGVRLSRHYLPKMMAKNWGRIIFISSESGVNIPVEMIHYGVTKTMQLALARGLAETTAGTAVTVNSVLAGPTRSEGVERFVDQIAQSRGIERSMLRKSSSTPFAPAHCSNALPPLMKWPHWWRSSLARCPLRPTEQRFVWTAERQFARLFDS